MIVSGLHFGQYSLCLMFAGEPSAGARPIIAPYSVDPSATRPLPSPAPPALRCGDCCALVLGLARGPRAQLCPVPRSGGRARSGRTWPERAENPTTPYARFPGRLRVEEWNSMESSSSVQNFDHPVCDLSAGWYAGLSDHPIYSFYTSAHLLNFYHERICVSELNKPTPHGGG